MLQYMDLPFEGRTKFYSRMTFQEYEKMAKEIVEENMNVDFHGTFKEWLDFYLQKHKYLSTNTQLIKVWMLKHEDKMVVVKDIRHLAFYVQGSVDYLNRYNLQIVYPSTELELYPNFNFEEFDDWATSCPILALDWLIENCNFIPICL